ncbi:class I SAM-dependent methyltransferase [Sedimentitalea sp. HM32M-2]|uniref:class I SAM-dependent methyltransferase n=1 Tax=Sedimentitalea sp. HM32M-2 TaxID=3351566 RepID=UPI0036417D44
MPETSEVAAYYASGSLRDRIVAGLEQAGARPPLNLDTLAQFDEFHIGGRPATKAFVQRLGLSAGSRILDLGCGLGGPARFIAKTTGARVTGIDLTREFVEVGRELTGMVLMVDRVELVQGSILDLPFQGDRFDVAYMIHVGMNIADKAALAAEAARVLKPGGLFAIYDVMATGTAPPTYPVPWASSADQSALATPANYRAALEGAGFRIESETDRTAFAQAVFAKRAELQADGLPVLGQHLVMGPDSATKIANLESAINDGRLAPVEIIARLPE